MTPTPPTRRCYGCRSHLPLAAFDTDRSKPGGKGYRCRACNRARCAAWYRENRERQTGQVRERRQKKREREALSRVALCALLVKLAWEGKVRGSGKSGRFGDAARGPDLPGARRDAVRG